MGNQASHDADQLSAQTQFDRAEIKNYYEQFMRKYTTGFMTRDEFIQENVKIQGGTPQFWDEVFLAFDTDSSGQIEFKEFVIGLSMLTSGTTADKLKWMFQLYDKDKNGVLDKQEVTAMFESLNNASEALHGSSIAASPEHLFNELDADKDGSITLEEFINACEHNHTIKDALGESLLLTMQVDTTAPALDTFGHQVAGHKGKASMLKDGKTILKPLAETEFVFYEHLKKQPEQVQRFFPRFFGRKSMHDSATDTTSHYIVLEDLTAGLELPSICDLKIGQRGHDKSANTKKVLQQKALCTVTTSNSLGFRMCGMRIWQSPTESYTVRDKMWGSKLTKKTMKDALVQFANNGNGLRLPLIHGWLTRLEDIKTWFREQTTFNFYSSSILLIYDTAAPAGEVVDVRLVDFAHTDIYRGKDSRDENYLKGLNKLINILQRIYKRGIAARCVYENESRTSCFAKFGSLIAGSKWTDENNDPALPPLEGWQVECSSQTDEQGWEYSFTYKQKMVGRAMRWQPKQSVKSMVRRRRWAPRS